MAVAHISGKAINYNLLFRRLHKWLALFVGIQLVMWTISGFIMSYVPIEEVHGDHLWDKQVKPGVVKPADVAFPLSALMAKYGAGNITAIRLFSRDGKAAYEVGIGKERLYLDAGNGEVMAPVTAQHAVAIARKAYRGTGQYKSIEYISDPAQYSEIRGHDLPLWKVNFADDVATSLYVSPDMARVTTARSDIWRRYDFFWMLHIMDYEEREDFNNALLVFAASVALFIAVSGILLIFYSFGRKDFRWVGKWNFRGIIWK